MHHHGRWLQPVELLEGRYLTSCSPVGDLKFSLKNSTIIVNLDFGISFLIYLFLYFHLPTLDPGDKHKDLDLKDYLQ